MSRTRSEPQTIPRDPYAPDDVDGPSRGALRPFLLDRLSDDWLLRHTAGPGDAVPPFHLVLDAEQYRSCVLRDLRWLLNTVTTPADRGRRQHAHVAASVLNYGLADFSRLSLLDVRGSRLRTMVQRAIQRFEPRIEAKTLHVRMISEAAAGVVSIVIEGTLWALPVPESLRLRGVLDVAAGRRWELTEL